MAETQNKPNEAKPGFQQGSAKPGDAKNPDNKQEKLNERLDEALEETFPSSDPVSVKITK
ncbi:MULTISPECIES: hypothetical protein [Methylobacterium]|jgi:hypothetical protein|uniref:Protein of unassigned function n=1 Tax=Methylobacterium oryzae CBMB20 TaxID=693986 RepID=A0A089NXV6_9HYPH|nr:MULTISPECIES: hypothetical protein [Methylobacterium]AIQ92776.1 protein of unassigned function [Methylobacterium oryzae CBMB20]AWV15729.1 hypothetical protein A3862_09590 [Methylobacterium sp. XJLW]WFS06657.1 hypothetical protein P9K36_25240 [Methylobacterium sp. 391_Methyba4]